MKITIVNRTKEEKKYTRVELDEFVNQLKDGTYHHHYIRDFNKDVCFAAEWQKQNGELKAKAYNPLILLSLENLRDLTTAGEYKQQTTQLPYTLLCFLGHDGHSIHIVCPYTVSDGDLSAIALLNAFRKLHYIYSSQLLTPLSEEEPTFESCCKASYDPQPYYNPEAMAITVTSTPETSPTFRQMQEEISDYNDPQEIPGVSLRTSRMRRFHDCLDAAIETHRDIRDEEMFVEAVLEQLADGCRTMGLPQAYAVRLATFIPLLGGVDNKDAIEAAFKTAYLRDTLKTIPLKYTRSSALLTYKTEAYMKEHYTLRLNVMTGTPEYKRNAVGYGFQPLNQAVRNTMAINALKAGIESWDKDLSRYIDSDLIPKYYPMDDYIRHLGRWDGKHDYVGELARRVKTDNPHWEGDFHTWMLSMVAQWTGKDRQHGNAIVPLLIGTQGCGKTRFCRRLLPEWLQTYYNDRLSMKSDNDIFIAMSSYALINIDEFDAMKSSQQPVLKYLLSKSDVKFRPPYGKVMEERQRFASFIATTNNRRPLIDSTGSRRFICTYTEEIDNTGFVPHDKIYAQLYTELQQGHRYWFEDEDNQRIMQQNQQFQRVSSYEQMILALYLAPEDTPVNAKPVLLKDIMRRLELEFPTFTIAKGTDMELGRRLSKMGYDSKRQNNGSAFRVVEKL